MGKRKNILNNISIAFEYFPYMFIKLLFNSHKSAFSHGPLSWIGTSLSLETLGMKAGSRVTGSLPTQHLKKTYETVNLTTASSI